jgi:hypothetical protein
MSTIKFANIQRLSNTTQYLTNHLVHNTKLWCAFNPSTGTPVISNSYSVGTIVDVAVGKYIVRPDTFTAANTASIMLGHVVYARDNNLTAANTGFSGFVGGNAQARIGTWNPTGGVFIDPLYVSVIGAYERIIK